MSIRLKQIASESAASGQGIVWDGTDWVPAGSAAGNARITSQALVATTSGTFIDGFAGASVSPPDDGDYLAVYVTEISGTNNSNVPEIAIGKNSTTVVADNSEMGPEVGNSIQSATTTALLTGLLTSDTVHGMVRRLSGNGNSGLANRSLRLIRVVS